MRRGDQRRAAVVALYQEEVTGRPAEELLDRRAPSFAHELVEGVRGHRDELDALIERHSIGWTLDRIAPLERSILRVALEQRLDRSTGHLALVEGDDRRAPLIAAPHQLP